MNMNRKRKVGSPLSSNMFTGLVMYQSIEIILTSQGKTMFQNLTQLQGAVIVRMAIKPPSMANYSSQTYSANIPTIDDYKNMFLSFKRGNVFVIQDMAALELNPFQDSDSTAATTANNNVFWDKLFSPTPIDFDQSYVWMASAPSSYEIVLTLGVSYYYP